MSVADILVWLGNRERTGTLTIAQGVVVKTVHVERGNAVRVTSTSPREDLGQLLLNLGSITPVALENAMLLAAETKMRLGRVLVLGNVLEEAEVRRAVEQQIRESVLDTVRWDVGHFEFRADERAIPKAEVTASVPMLAIHKLAAARAPHWAAFHLAFPRLDVRLRIEESAVAPEADPVRDHILALIREGATVETVLQQMLMMEYEIYARMYDLVRAGTLRSFELAAPPPSISPGDFSIDALGEISADELTVPRSSPAVVNIPRPPPITPPTISQVAMPHTTPHGAMPHAATPHAAMPHAAMPHAAMPHAATPHAAMPYGAMPPPGPAPRLASDLVPPPIPQPTMRPAPPFSSPVPTPAGGGTPFRGRTPTPHHAAGIPLGASAGPGPTPAFAGSFGGFAAPPIPPPSAFSPPPQPPPSSGFASPVPSPPPFLGPQAPTPAHAAPTLRVPAWPTPPSGAVITPHPSPPHGIVTATPDVPRTSRTPPPRPGQMSSTVSAQAIPHLVGGLDEALRIRNSPRERYILKRIDGTRTIADILQIVPMSDREVIDVLRGLVAAGLVRVG